VSQVILLIAPNDFDIRLPGFFTRTRLRRIIREITPVVEAILKDLALPLKLRGTICGDAVIGHQQYTARSTGLRSIECARAEPCR